MSNLAATQSTSPGCTYGPEANPQLSAFARRVFFLSVGSAAVPVIFAAGIMLQSGQGLPSKHSLAKSAGPATALPLAPVAAHNPAPQPPRSPSLESLGNAAPVGDGISRIPAQPLARFDAEIARGQYPREESDIFHRDSLVRLAVISVPTSPGIPDTNATAVEERSAPVVTATQVKKIRAELKTNTIARHRYRPQRHAPPSLLAKIGESVKKGLIQAAKFPREAMAGHHWE